MYFVHPQLKTIKPLFYKVSEAELKERLAEIFPGLNIIFTDSGRSAFQIAIKELNLENSTMLVPAYLCDIFLPIFEKYKIKPIYIDINLNTFQPEISSIEQKIKPETKSVLICHTYGLPADLDKITEIARKHNLKIIEDCAHACPPLAGSADKVKGDCLFFSFAKICPNINGGILISKLPIKTELPKYRLNLSNIVKFLRLYPATAGLSEKFRKDKTTKNETDVPRRASKISLKLFNYYLKNRKEQILKRIELAKYFHEKLSDLGFKPQEFRNNTYTYLSVLIPQEINRDDFFEKLRKSGIFCSRVWQKPIYPNLPNTAEAAKRIINLPLQSWYSKKDIDKIISCILSALS